MITTFTNCCSTFYDSILLCKTFSNWSRSSHRSRYVL